MERNANYALVGLISTLLLAGLLIFATVLAGGQFNRAYDNYDIVFQGPVRGIAQGGEVHFNGIKVGDIRRIGLDPNNSTLVVARARVTSDVPVRVDSYATLEPLGITGVNYIQITAGTPGQPLLKSRTPFGTTPRLESHKDALSDLLAGGGFVVQRAVEALERVNRILSDDNIETLTATMRDVHAVTAELAAHKEIVADTGKAVQDADEAARQIAELAKSSKGLVDDEGRRSLSQLGDAAKAVAAAAHQLQDTTQRLDGPATAFATTGLPQLTQTVESLQRATDHLDRVLGQVESNPRGVLAKAPAKDVEIKP